VPRNEANFEFRTLVTRFPRVIPIFCTVSLVQAQAGPLSQMILRKRSSKAADLWHWMRDTPLTPLPAFRIWRTNGFDCYFL
jgi:hypothetical protein